MLADSCVTIRDDDLPTHVAKVKPSSIVFSKDRKQIAGFAEDAVDHTAIFVIDSAIPNNKAIVAAAEKTQDKAKTDKIYARADKMFKAGFAEEALPLLNDLIEQKSDNPMSTRLAITYILGWARELPLADVGKSLLRHIELILAQPELAAQGFSASKNPAMAGIVVKTISPQGNADKAGLKIADIVLEADGVPIANWEEFKALIAKSHPGTSISLTVSRHGNLFDLSLPLDGKRKGIVWAAMELAEYGTIASAAGHPELTMAAARQLRELSHEYRSSLMITAMDNFSRMLESLSMISSGDSIGAYKHAVKNGGFVKEFDIILVFHFNDPNSVYFVAPLFENRKKLAFLLGLEESKLRKTPTHTFTPQDYPDLSGKIVPVGKKASGVTSVSKKIGEKKLPPKKPKILLLD